MCGHFLNGENDDKTHLIGGYLDFGETLCCLNRLAQKDLVTQYKG